MGLFLAMSGVAGASAEEVENALASYARDRSIPFEPATDRSRDDDRLLLLEGNPKRVTVLYPVRFLEWTEVSKFLSQSLQRPVFSFHIHDGDLWMYELFDCGQPIDGFNPLPDYWGEITPEERSLWKGNAAEVCKHWPGLQEQQIRNYLVPWDDDGTEDRKAYPDDEYTLGQDWQLVDFMKRLGLRYPERHDRLAKSFIFEVE